MEIGWDDVPLPGSSDIYTVTELTEAIRQSLESEFPHVDVIGEIANFKAHTSGHLYFSLRDETNLIRAVVFRGNVKTLSFGPENGMLVVASGRLSHYGGSGQTELIVRTLIPAGRGQMELEYMKLLRKLMDEGLTSPERKRPIPQYPARIVVITSPTGAVIRDILDTLRRRWPVAEVVHIGTDVQGAGAARSIMGAFEAANRIGDADVVILARGGGSVEDLWTFNMEGVARAVAGSVHPVITGIGHEIDTTVADYVSDKRAATPTAAAEIATPVILDVRKHVEKQLENLLRLYRDSSSQRLHLLEYLLRSSAFPALVHRLERAELDIDARVARLRMWWDGRRREKGQGITACMSGLERAVERTVGNGESRLVRKLGRLSLNSPEKKIAAAGEALKRIGRILQVRTTSTMALRNHELRELMRAMKSLHPRGVLKRGYTYCTTPDDEAVISRARGIARNEKMMVNFYDGGALCRIERKRKGKPCPRK